MRRNMAEWVRTQLAAKRKHGFLLLSSPAVQKLGITVTELVCSPERMAEATILNAELTPSCAAMGILDLSVEAEAFGCPLNFSDTSVPGVAAHIVTDRTSAEALPVPEVGAGRTGLFVEGIRLAAPRISDRPLLACVIGPFSLAGCLMGFSDCITLCAEEPETVHIVLRKAVEFLIRYSRAFYEAGADGILIAEPLGGLLSPSMGMEFANRYVGEVTAAVQREDFSVWYRNCGNGVVGQADSIRDTGCRVLLFGNHTPLGGLLEQLPSDRLVLGNVDPVSCFRDGTPELVRSVTEQLLRDYSSYPNFIPASGCDLPPSAGWDNIHAFYEAIDRFYGEEAEPL